MSDLRPLLAACAQGDFAAWREFVRLTLPRVERAVRRLIESSTAAALRPRADDVAAAVYEALRRDRGRALQRLGDGDAWALRLALHARRAFREALGSGAETAAPTSIATEASVLAWNAYRTAPLDARERAAVGLFYFRGLRYAPIADLLGLPPPEAASLVRTGAGKILVGLPGADPAGGGAFPAAPGAAKGCPVPWTLFDFVHREVGEEQRRGVAGHVERCGACRALADSFRHLLTRMAAAAPTRGEGNCLADDELIALAGRRVPAATRTRVETHLAECRSCWEGHEFLAAMGPEAPPPAGPPPETPLAQRVLALGPPAGPPEGSGNLRVRSRTERFRSRRQRIVQRAVNRRLRTGVIAGLGVALVAVAVTAARRGRDAPEGSPGKGRPRGGGRSEKSQPADRERPREEAQAAIEDVRGRLHARRGLTGRAEEVPRTARIAPWDTLVAYDDGAVFTTGGATIGIREGTLRIASASPGALVLDLGAGEAYVRVAPGGPSVAVEGPHGRVDVAPDPKGASACVVQAWTDRTAVVVHEGRASLRGERGSAEVTAGGRWCVRRADAPAQAPEGAAAPAAWVSRDDGAGGAARPYFDLLVPACEGPADVVIAAPHAASEPGSGGAAARLGRVLGAPVVFARHFEPMDVNRPAATRWAAGPDAVPEGSAQARVVHDEFRASLLQAAGRPDSPIPVYVEIHGDELTGPAPFPAVEMVTQGWDEASLKRMKEGWERGLGRVPREAWLPLRVDLLDPVATVDGKDVPFAFRGYPGSIAHGGKAAGVERALVVRLPAPARRDEETARQYGEALAEAVRAGMGR